MKKTMGKEMKKEMKKKIAGLAMGTALLAAGMPAGNALAAESSSGESGAAEITEVMARYGQDEFDAYISLEGAVDRGDYYEIQAMLCVPLAFSENPAAGKQEGDKISIPISDVSGRTAVFEKNSSQYEEDFLDFTCMYQPFEQDGQWRVLGPNDMEMAKEVYNGTLRLDKYALAVVFDYGELTYTNNGIKGYEYISVEEMVERPEDYGTWNVVGKPAIPDDTEYDEIVVDGSGKIQMTGEKKTRPGYIVCPGEYHLTLNEDGEIMELERQWRP